MFKPIASSSITLNQQEPIINQEPISFSQSSLPPLTDECVEEKVPIPVQVVRDSFRIFKESVLDLFEFVWQKVDTYDDTYCLASRSQELVHEQESPSKFTQQGVDPLFSTAIKTHLAFFEIEAFEKLSRVKAQTVLELAQKKYIGVMSEIQERHHDITLEDQQQIAMAEAKSTFLERLDFLNQSQKND